MARVLRIVDASPHKITNPVFNYWTSGAPDNWTSTGSPNSDQLVSEGSIQSYVGPYALQVSNGGSSGVRGFYQDITDVEEGQTYYIQVYVKNISGVVRVYAWDGGGTSNAVFAESVAGTDWQEVIVAKEAAAGGIRIGLIAFDAGSSAAFDLIQLGTFHIEFIEGAQDAHLRVTNWEIEVADLKGSGVFASSPVGEGRQLIDGYWDNATQTISFHLRGTVDQNTAILKLSELLSALQAARDFNKSHWALAPAYLQFKAENETKFKYALIANARIPQLADPFTIEFKQLAMRDLDLILEHPVPLSVPPGQGMPALAGVLTSYNSQNYGNYDGSGDPLYTAEEAFVANGWRLCNITNMHLGTAGSNLIGGSFPRQAAASNTATYFGINTSLADSGQFGHLVVHVSRVAVGSVTGDWQYWDGGTWQSVGTLATIDTSNGFTVLGTHVINLFIDDNSVALTPGGSLPTGYWFRYLATGTYSTTPQIDREVYSPTRNYIELPSSSVPGNIAALAGIYARNWEGAPYWVDKIYMGLRSVERGADFQSMINLGDDQNHSDITLSYDTGVSAVSTYTIDESVGVVARSTAASEKYVEIEIGGNLAHQMVGEYHCFLICHKNYQATVSAWMSYKMIEGMNFEVNEAHEWGTQISAWDTRKAVFDLGLMVIDGAALGGLLPDKVIIRVHTTTDTTDNLDRCQFVMIPVDEYQMIADRLETFAGEISRWGGRDDNVAQMGSAQFVKAMGRSNFLTSPTGSLEEAQVKWISRANGPMILQQGAKQRLYFLVTSQWLTEAESQVCWQDTLTAVRLVINPRWLGLRGNS